jgi:hypothetical protein
MLFRTQPPHDYLLTKLFLKPMSEELPEGCHFSVQKIGGEHDGMTFNSFVDQVTGCGYFTCDQFSGKRFKQVFMPIDFEHPDIVDE